MELLAKRRIRDIPDFPSAGILFKDITPVLQDPKAFGEVMERMLEYAREQTPDAIVGIGQASDGSSRLLVRVRAVPEKGAANLALERLLAERLAVSRTSVAVVAGATSRLKTVRIAGDAEILAGRAAG